MSCFIGVSEEEKARLETANPVIFARAILKEMKEQGFFDDDEYEGTPYEVFKKLPYYRQLKFWVDETLEVTPGGGDDADADAAPQTAPPCPRHHEMARRIRMD